MQCCCQARVEVWKRVDGRFRVAQVRILFRVSKENRETQRRNLMRITVLMKQDHRHTRHYEHFSFIGRIPK